MAKMRLIVVYLEFHVPVEIPIDADAEVLRFAYRAIPIEQAVRECFRIGSAPGIAPPIAPRLTSRCFPGRKVC